MFYGSGFRPSSLLDKYTVPWTVRETAALARPATNPSDTPTIGAGGVPSQLSPPEFNLLAPLYNSAKAIQIGIYDAQKETGYEWLFNYKAILNTRVQTITTDLTNALNSDLEEVFSLYAGGVRRNQQLPSGIWVFEPAPAADAWAYLYGASINASDPTTSNPGAKAITTPIWDASITSSDDPANSGTPTGTYGNNFGNVSGTQAGYLAGLASGSQSTNPPSFVLNRAASNMKTSGTRVIQSGGSVQGTATQPVVFQDGTQRDINNATIPSSKFWATYIQLFLDPSGQYVDCWRYGLLDKVVIAGTAASGNGSQMQSSLTLRDPNVLQLGWVNPVNGKIVNLGPGGYYPFEFGVNGVEVPTPTPGTDANGNPITTDQLVLENSADGFSGGSTVNSSSQYNENYIQSVGANAGDPETGPITDAHGFIQSKFTAFWHS